MSNAVANSGSVAGPEDDPLEKPDAAVIAPRHARRDVAAASQADVLVASLALAVLAVVAHTVAHSSIDLTITCALLGAVMLGFHCAMRAPCTPMERAARDPGSSSSQPHSS
jgi:hypothetical protein